MIGEIISNHFYFCIASALIIFYLTKRFLFQKRYNLPPGPWSPPLIGNFKEAFGNLCYLKWANELRQQYGDVFLIYTGRQPTVIVNNYDLAVEAFVTKYPKELAGRPYMKILHELSEKSNDIIMASYGPRWKRQRMIAHAALRKFMQGLKVEQANINSFNMFSEELTIGEPIDVVEPLYQLTVNVMCGVLFNEVYSVGDKEYDLPVTIKTMNKEILNIVYVGVFPFLWDFPFPALKRYKNLFHKYTDYFVRKMEEHKQTLTEDPRDICDCLLLELQQNKEKNEILSEHHIRLVLSDLLIAGTDTSQGVLHWMVGLLASYPHIQQKMFDEISAYKNTLPPGNKAVSLEWRDHLPYTNAVINEVLRYSAVVPKGLSHEALADCKIGGYDVPKGSIVNMNIYAFHNDPKYWKEPDLFNPQRFLDSNGKLIPKVQGLAPFSFGPRVCLGESVAKADIFMMTVLLCSNYEFVWYEGNEESVISISPDSNIQHVPNQFKVIINQR